MITLIKLGPTEKSLGNLQPSNISLLLALGMEAQSNSVSGAARSFGCCKLSNERFLFEWTTLEQCVNTNRLQLEEGINSLVSPVTVQRSPL